MFISPLSGNFLVLSVGSVLIFTRKYFKVRRSGRDCRNLEHMDVKILGLALSID
jgi:hypothetical protein